MVHAKTHFDCVRMTKFRVAKYGINISNGAFIQIEQNINHCFYFMLFRVSAVYGYASDFNIIEYVTRLR